MTIWRLSYSVSPYSNSYRRDSRLVITDYVSVETFLFRVAGQIGLEFQKVEQLTPDDRKWPIFILTIPNSTPSNGSPHCCFTDISTWYLCAARTGRTSLSARSSLTAASKRAAHRTSSACRLHICALSTALRAHRMSSVSHAPLFNRTVQVLFTSDEEIGSPIFSLFVPSPFFLSALALDEGICSPY